MCARHCELIWASLQTWDWEFLGAVSWAPSRTGDLLTSQHSTDSSITQLLATSRAANMMTIILSYRKASPISNVYLSWTECFEVFESLFSQLNCAGFQRHPWTQERGENDRSEPHLCFSTFTLCSRFKQVGGSRTAQEFKFCNLKFQCIVLLSPICISNCIYQVLQIFLYNRLLIWHMILQYLCIQITA